ncbi:hypothetical protein Lal_00037751 [Lupinus albus]|nr:hypothetical protein Lal_00037751 [Lupinus albus]
MSEPRRTRVKIIAKRSRNMDVGGFSSTQGRKQTNIRYANMSWLVEQAFEFPHCLEVQGANTFMEMSGNIYPTLIQEFYSNFQYREGLYFSMVRGKLITVHEDLFFEVGGLSSVGSPLGVC